MLAKNTMRQRPTANREAIEYQLCKFWRSQGKLSWTDAELAMAVDERLQKASPRPLFDTGAAAAQSRAAAYAKVARNQSDRREDILRLIREAGQAGATRAELSTKLHCQQSSICRPILDLLASGDLVELSDKRTSQYGGAGVVIVLAEFAEVTANG